MSTGSAIRSVPPRPRSFAPGKVGSGTHPGARMTAAAVRSVLRGIASLRISRYAPLLLVVLLAGCETVTAVVAPKAPPPPDPKTLMPALEQRIAVLIADERMKLAPNAKPL